MTLDQAPAQHTFRVSAFSSDASVSTLINHLEDIGFICGEHVSVLRVGHQKKPYIVRIGLSTFALRQEEAQLIHLSESV